MPSARVALAALKAGNRRFVDGVPAHVQDAVTRRREALAGGQRPSAVVLGCSDSRVPPEVIFDQGLGELFVIRVAGNIANPSQVGSVEFAVQVLGVRLVVVLGHTGCGAVVATLEEILTPHGPPSPGMASIVDVIRPVVEPLVRESGVPGVPALDQRVLMDAAVEANVQAAVGHIREGVSPLPPEVEAERGPVVVVGARYDVDSGAVVFLGP
ncbi:MAG TPA: carbonic anhydrase [Longimicrobiales bacterium]|nr:carbonic anhydrase [Longimicrobiales bacterium]